MGAWMNVRWVSRWAAPLSAALLLVSCDESAMPPFLQSDGEAAASEGTDGLITPTTDIVERDVEAPDVFSTTEAGLWDGRPSLGGVWVAHPDVQDPERAIIRNTENGVEVIGALFRRERDNPGPRLQVSSDAASALNMLAGAPSELSVVVLRREEEEIIPEEPETELAEAETTEPELAEPEPLIVDVIEPVEEPETETAAASEVAAPPARQAPAAPVMSAETIAAQVPDTPLSEDALAPLAAAAIAVAEAEAAAQAEAAAEPSADVEGVEEVTVAPLVQPTPAPTTTANEVAAELETVDTAATAEEPVTTLEKPYIQVGIFNEFDNAAGAGQRLRDAGVIPTLLEQESNGRAFFRIVIGPAQNERMRQVLLDKVRGLGYSDAYFVTN